MTAFLLPAWAIEPHLLSTTVEGDTLATVDLLQRKHRRAEGRDADAPQHPRERRRRSRRSSSCTNDDVLVGVLPFFHSFGFTGTLWLPVLSGFGVVYHPNPMDAKTIGELAETLSRQR